MSSAMKHVHAYLFLTVLVATCLVYSCDTGPTAVDAQPGADAGSGDGLGAPGDCNCVVPDTLSVEVPDTLSVDVATMPHRNLFELLVSGKLTQHSSLVTITGTVPGMDEYNTPISIEPGHVFITRVACQYPPFFVARVIDSTTTYRYDQLTVQDGGRHVLKLIPGIYARDTSSFTHSFSESFDAPIYVDNVGSRAALEVVMDSPVYTNVINCDFTYYVYRPEGE